MLLLQAVGAIIGIEQCSVEMFDWSTKTWSPLQPMKECCAGACSFVYEDQLIVTGGHLLMPGLDTIDTMARINIKPIMDSTPWLDFPAKLPEQVVWIQ